MEIESGNYSREFAENKEKELIKIWEYYRNEKGMKSLDIKIDKVINLDCLIGLENMPDKCIDMVITSPPYDNLREYNNSSLWSLDVFYKIAPHLYRIVKDGGVVVWIVGDSMKNGSETGTSFKQALYFKECGFLLHDTMIWKKPSPFQHKNRYIQSFEYMFIFSKGIPKTVNLICDRKNKWAGTKVHGSERQIDGSIRSRSETQKSKVIKEYGARFNIWEINPVKHNQTGHPAPFPEQLVLDHILSWSNENDVILDPFMGSGTTAIAAIKSNRHFIGFEIDTTYYQQSIERIENERNKTK